MARHQVPRTAVVAATGTAQIDLLSRGTRPWVVDQVSVSNPAAPSGSTCQLNLNGVFVTALIPTGDVADGNPPVVVNPLDVVSVVWAGCTTGQICSALFFYDDGI